MKNLKQDESIVVHLADSSIARVLLDTDPHLAKMSLLIKRDGSSRETTPTIRATN